MTSDPSNEPMKIRGLLHPANDTFDAVNRFVHHEDVTFEELQATCLSLALKLERATKPN
jgi:hypothetical protein